MQTQRIRCRLGQPPGQMVAAPQASKKVQLQRGRRKVGRGIYGALLQSHAQHSRAASPALVQAQEGQRPHPPDPVDASQLRRRTTTPRNTQAIHGCGWAHCVVVIESPRLCEVRVPGVQVDLGHVQCVEQVCRPRAACSRLPQPGLPESLLLGCQTGIREVAELASVLP